MTRRILSCLIALTFLLSSTGPLLAAQPSQQSPPITTAAVPTQAAVSQAFRASPVMFIQNVGQFAAGARFQVRGGNNTMWLAEDAIWVTVVERQADDIGRSHVETLERFASQRAKVERENMQLKATNIKLSFVGANPRLRIEPFDRLDTVVSYFIGNDPEKWRPDVPVWGGVRYADLYPGVDLELTSKHGQMVQRLAARPDADLSAVRLRVEGAEAVTLDADTLRLTTAAGEAALPLLRTDGTQLAGAKAQARGTQAFDIAAPFAPANANSASRNASSRQSAMPEKAGHAVENRQSVADNPADLLYGTFLGGSNDDVGYGIAVDGAGSAYMTGATYSSDFPTTPGAFDTSFNDSADAFVIKLNGTGSTLAYATFLGGSNADYGYGIAVDGAGSAYVTGRNDNGDFPTTPDAFDTSFNGSADAFVVKLNGTGSGLTYATFLGGSAGDYGLSVAVDGTGSVYMTGHAQSSDFPTTPGAFDTSSNGDGDAFVVKLNPFGSDLTYATFLGGSDSNWSDANYGSGIAVDGAGSAYVTGVTYCSDFPVTWGAFDTSFNGNGDAFGDAFVVKLNPSGSGLAYATFLGGSDGDESWGIAVNGAGSAYVTGMTYSSDFPSTPGAFDTSFNDSTDTFVVKLNGTGSALAYATFLGGSDSTYGSGIAVDEAGSAYVTGVTASSDFPTTPGAFDTSLNGTWDAYVVRFNPVGSGLAYATFLGGGDFDRAYSIAVDAAGRSYVTGFTDSANFPTTPGAFDTSYNGGLDAFVVKLTMGGGATYSISGRVTNGGGQPVAGASVSAGAGGSATTDGNGAYTISGLAAGTYTLVPSKPGYSFSPYRLTVNLKQDTSGQDFVGVHQSPGGFLSLPFDFGGTESAFQTALGDTWDQPAGRVDSWFDHEYPTYGTNGGLVLFTGQRHNIKPYGDRCYNSRCYDGHNGLDFNYVDPDKLQAGSQDLPIVAAASGQVVKATTACTAACKYGSCKACGSYGNYVLLYHDAGYFTFYGHLRAVQVSDQQTLAAGQTLGMMGNTGHVSGSDGTHLHFGVYADTNANGLWDNNVSGKWNTAENFDNAAVDKVADPFGWDGNTGTDVVYDPWLQVPHSQLSTWLWGYRLTTSQTGDGRLPLRLADSAKTVQAVVAPGTFIGQVTLELSLNPVAAPSAQLRSAGRSFSLRLLQGTPAAQQQPGSWVSAAASLAGSVAITATYLDVPHLDLAQLSLYSWDNTQANWQPLATTLQTATQQAVGQTSTLGDFSLQAPLLCPADAVEPDDSYFAARDVITNTAAIGRLFDVAADEDWFRLEAAAGEKFVLDTQQLALGVDAILELYDIDGLSLIAADDEGGGGKASHLEWRAPENGIYFVRVAPTPGSALGCNATYELSAHEMKQVYLPMAMRQ